MSNQLPNNENYETLSENLIECVKAYNKLTKVEKIRFQREFILKHSVSCINPSGLQFNESNNSTM